MSPRTVACRACGALNEPDFGACIRCGASLADAEPAAGARRVPAPRRAGQPVLGPGAEPLFGKYPPEALPVAKALLLLNLLVFMAQMMGMLSRGGGTGGLILGGNPLEGLLYGALPQPHPAYVGLDPEALILHEPWRFLSACFVHFGVLHVGMNMFWLIRLSQLIEPLIGSVRLLVAYVVSGIASFVASFGWAMYAESAPVTAGASGAVFGVMGILLGIALRRGEPRFRARIVESVVVAVAIGFIVPFINNAAHVGGLVAGTLFGLAHAPSLRQPSRRFQRALAVLAFAACIAAVVLPRFSPLYPKALDQLEQERLKRVAP